MHDPRASDCPDLSTECCHRPITLGMVLWNYYDGEWVVVTKLPGEWDRGWFDTVPLKFLALGLRGDSLNGVRVACQPRCRR